MTKKQAYLILTHRISQALTNHYETVRAATRSTDDSLLLYHLKDGDSVGESSIIPSATFTDNVITGLNYFPIGFHLIPGNNHFPLLDFYLKNPDYDYYWVIEDDVRFSGSWRVFFDTFDEVEKDFISCHVRTSAEEPYWHWWSSLANPYRVIPFDQRIRSFNPIYRISGKALAFIHASLQKGWCGHHEVLFATLLNTSGYTIADFGGVGQFVMPGFKNRFYVSGPGNDYGNLKSGTMKWRPMLEHIGDLRNKLYHPVKE